MSQPLVGNGRVVRVRVVSFGKAVALHRAALSTRVPARYTCRGSAWWRCAPGPLAVIGREDRYSDVRFANGRK